MVKRHRRGTRAIAVWKTLEKGPHRRWVLARALDRRRTCLIGEGEFVPWEKTGVPDFGRCGGDGGGGLAAGRGSKAEPASHPSLANRCNAPRLFLVEAGKDTKGHRRAVSIRPLGALSLLTALDVQHRLQYCVNVERIEAMVRSLQAFSNVRRTQPSLGPPLSMKICTRLPDLPELAKPVIHFCSVASHLVSPRGAVCGCVVDITFHSLASRLGSSFL